MVNCLSSCGHESAHFGVIYGSSWYPAFWFRLREIGSSSRLLCPKARFNGFVHYLCKVVGWQLGKWELGGNILGCEHNVMCGKGLGREIILEKLGAAEFCCAGRRSEVRI